MKNSRGAYRMMADLIAISDSIADFIVHRSDVRLTNRLESHKFTRTLKRLVDVGYLDTLGKDRFLITDRGKIDMLSELVKRRKPDGKMRVVFFDIPEKLRTRRNAFRRHLEKLEFKMEQRSVWSSKLPCEDLVKLVIKYHGLKNFTSLIVGGLVH